MKISPRHVIRPDETLYSWVSRLHAMSTNIKNDMTYSDLFSRTRVRIHPFLPAHIGDLSKNTGVTSKKLIEGHTLYPLFRFYGLDKNSRLRDAMLGNDGGQAIMIARLPHSKLKFFRGTKFCPICIESEREKDGFGIFRVRHQIPGVDACHLHRCLLNGLKSGDYGYDGNLSLPPKATAKIPANNFQIEFSSFVSNVLDIAIETPLSLDHRAISRRILHERGLLTKSGSFRMHKFVNTIRDSPHAISFGAVMSFPELMKSFQFIGPMIREKTHYPAHPSKHLLFHFLLFNGDTGLYHRTGANDIELREDDSSSESSASSEDSRVIELLKAGKSMNYIESITSKSRSFIKRAAKLNEIDVMTNTRATPQDVARSVWSKAFYGFDRKEISAELNISVSYVETVISHCKGLAQWRRHLKVRRSVLRAYNELMTARKNHPDWKIKDIKRAYSKAYHCLYHNDRKILDTVMPRKTKPIPPSKDWETLDDEICQALKNIDHKGMSLSQLDDMLLGSGMLLSHLDKLPRVKKRLSSNSRAIDKRLPSNAIS